MSQLGIKVEPRLEMNPVAVVPPAAPALAWAEVARFAVVGAELGLLVWIIRLFQLENARFGDLAVLAWVGFVIHHFLPLPLCLPFFVVLSLAGLKLVLGGTVAVCVTGIGLILIAVCHLPIRFSLRVGLLLLMAAGLAALKKEWLSLGGMVNPAAWTILGSMFMFRLIAYLYDLRHQAAPFGPFRAMAYFFMLPNVCFPFFPVVDYKTFCTTYFKNPPLQIYQTGLRWMLRGIVHLLLYRVVYQVVQIDPMEVTDLGGVARFMASAFLLYLRVSGQFHLIVGLLHLFGFHLPETHHLYYLSSSFTDLWRRINIYWKDFVTKIFFYPIYFRLKRLGPTWALALATAGTMIVTWLLHSYQFFWLRGTFLLTFRDASFWWLMTGLVLVNALFEAKHGRARTLTRPRRTFWTETSLALRTVAIFVTMCVLWTYWSGPSKDELSWLARAATHVTPRSLAAIAGVLVGVGVAAVVLGRSAAERNEAGSGKLSREGGSSFARSAWGVGLVSCVVLLVGVLPEGPALRGTTLGTLVAAVQKDQPNQAHVNELRRGYYEELDVGRKEEFFSFFAAPKWWNAPDDRFQRQTNDFMLRELVPTETVTFHDKPLTINRWGMRDRDYEKIKPHGVLRIVLLGTSHDFGSGVADSETYENLVEGWLNEKDGGRGLRYEILNFSVPGHSTLQYLAALENKALDFDPDVVLFSVCGYDIKRVEEVLASVLKSGCEIPYDFLTAVVNEAGIDRSRSAAWIEADLRKHMPKIMEWAYRQIAEKCIRRGVSVYAIFRPQPMLWSKANEDFQADARQKLLNLARQVGLGVLDLSAAFDDVKNRRSLMVAPWDDHTNAVGHRLLAEELYRKLHDQEGRLILQPRGGTHSP